MLAIARIIYKSHVVRDEFNIGPIAQGRTGG